jgi:hypothetical protein
MPRAKPEFAIFISVLGALLAIGVPALRRDNVLLGWSCLGLAIVVIAWACTTLWRARQS